MRLSEFNIFEIVDISTGTRQGGFGEGNLLFEEQEGKIKALLVPGNRTRAGFFSYNESMQIPWENIRKIGQDLIIVESGQTLY